MLGIPGYKSSFLVAGRQFNSTHRLVIVTTGAAQMISLAWPDQQRILLLFADFLIRSSSITSKA
jgi:hypothetical protein